MASGAKIGSAPQAKAGFFARAKGFFSRGKPAAGTVLPCGAAAAPPVPSKPCDLDEVVVRTGIKAKYTVHATVLKSGKAPHIWDGATPPPVGLDDDEMGLLRSHAVVIDRLCPFTEPDKAPTQSRPVSDATKLDSIELKGGVEFLYDATCGAPLHPGLVSEARRHGDKAMGKQTLGDFERKKQGENKALADRVERDAKLLAIKMTVDPIKRAALLKEHEKDEKQRLSDEEDDPPLPPGSNTFQPLELKLKAAAFDWEWLRDRFKRPSEFLSSAPNGHEAIVTGFSCGYPTAISQQGKPQLTAFVRFRALTDVSFDVQFLRGIGWSASKSKKIERASLFGGVTKTTDKETRGKSVLYRSAEISKTSTVGTQHGETVVDDETWEGSVAQGWHGKDEPEPVKIDYLSQVARDDPKLSAAENAARRKAGETADLARSMRSDALFKDKPDPLLPDLSKSARKSIEGVTKTLQTPLAGGVIQIALVCNGNRLDTNNAVKALESLQAWLNDIQSVLRILSDLSSAASGALFPVQLEVGFTYDLTLLKGAVVGRRWFELQQPVEGSRYYFDRAKSRWQVRFDLTIVDGNFTFSVGGRVAVFHKWVASIGISVEFSIGGSVRVAFPLITDGSESREVNLTTRIPASLGAKGEANALAWYVEMKGDIAGGLIYRWVYAYRDGELKCLVSNLRSEEITAKFVISRGNKLKARFSDEYEPTIDYQRPKNGRATWIAEGKINRDWV